MTDKLVDFWTIPKSRVNFANFQVSQTHDCKVMASEDDHVAIVHHEAEMPSNFAGML